MEHLHVNKWKQFKTSLLLMLYLVLVLAILGARWFTEPENRTQGCIQDFFYFVILPTAQKRLEAGTEYPTIK